jgi:PhnB protein
VRLRVRARHNLDEIATNTPQRAEDVTLDYFMSDYVDHLEHHLRQIPDTHRPVRAVKGIPDTSSVVIPRLVCRDPAREIEFCAATFNAVELGRRPGPDGSVEHALLTIGPAMIMIEAEWPALPSRAPDPDGSSPVVIFVYVSDVDQVVERAVARGARVLVPAQNQFWGDRIAWIQDQSGHVWTVATRVEETTPQERQDRWSSIVRDRSTE